MFNWSVWEVIAVLIVAVTAGYVLWFCVFGLEPLIKEVERILENVAADKDDPDAHT